MIRPPAWPGAALVLGLAGFVASELSMPPGAGADVLTVTDCGDTTPGGAPGQLRRLITDAASGDTIVVPACTIVLTGGVAEDANAGGDLDIATSLTIQGAGRDATIIDGAHRDRVFDVLSGTVTLRDMTIQNGGADFFQFTNEGGGVRNAGTLSLIATVVRMNDGGAEGGGIHNRGVLTVADSTVSGNVASFSVVRGGGGIFNAGGVATVISSTISGNVAGCAPICAAHGGGLENNGGVLHVTNTTVSQNQAIGAGGGLGGGIHSFDGVLTLVSSTVTDNRVNAVGSGAGLLGTGVVSVQQSIIAGNIVGASPTSPAHLGDCGLGQFIDSAGSNISSDASCNFTTFGDRVNTDPRLGPLTDNGGPTLTRAPLPGSPAIDGGPAICFPATDQRGVPRPQPAGGRCDIGAVEVVLVFSGGVYVAVGNVNGGAAREIVTGPGPGGQPRVRAFNASGTNVGIDVLAFPAGFGGGVRVASCDLDGDGRDDLVLAAGPGGGPHVRALSGANPALQLVSFFPYPPGFAGGVFVACAPIEGPGVMNILTGADAGGGPHVRVFRYSPASPGGVLDTGLSFFAYHPAFTGGVRVAACDLDGDGRADLVLAAGPGGGPHVRALSGANPALELASFFAYPIGFPGGVFVACGPLPGGPRIVTGAGAGGGPHVRGFTPAGADAGVSFFAYPVGFAGGVHVAVGDVTGDGQGDIVTGPGPGGGPHIRAFTAAGAALPTSFFAY
jgi:hypothetical protein